MTEPGRDNFRTEFETILGKPGPGQGPAPVSCFTSLVHIDSCESTNDEAKRLASEGAPHGTVVVADSQTAGKGRFGRRWTGAGPKGLYMSILLRTPYGLEINHSITVLGAVACAEVIRTGHALQATLRWPNDVFIGDRKVAGVLAESTSCGGVYKTFVLGIGVNLNHQREDFPEELATIGTSLAIESGNQVNRAEFAAQLARQVSFWFDKVAKSEYEHLSQKWLGLSSIRGKEVELMVDGKPLKGRVSDMDLENGLYIKDGYGSMFVFKSETVEKLKIL